MRIQGNAAHFVSGQHKTMPWDSAAVLELFRQLRGRMPLSQELDSAMELLGATWPSAAAKARKRCSLAGEALSEGSHECQVVQFGRTRPVS